MTLTKRNGKVEKLSKSKIFDSICNANSAVEEDERLTQKQIRRISDSVYAYCENLEEPIGIDILEDLIEKKIMENGGYEVAKRYITYRYEKERVRMNKALTEKLTASNVQNQNANVDEFSFGGRIGEAASFVARQYALDHLISKKAKHNHNNNEIYIHDLDSYAIGDHNCLSIPFDKLLADGFKTRQCDVRPAGSINTAFQLVAVLFQIQSLQQFGGVSATHLDWTMVPYVRKSFRKHWLDGIKYITYKSLPEDARKTITPDEYVGKFDIKSDTPIESPVYMGFRSAYEYAMDKTVRELEQAVEGMYHNLNTLQSRSGAQLPFSSINYGTCTLPEGRMVIRALLEKSIEGVGPNHATSIFPCGIFQCKEGVNRKPGDPNYDLFQLALKSTSLRLYPNYCNCDWTVQNGWVEFDRDIRQKILDSLSDDQKKRLIEIVEKDPRIGGHLLIDVVEQDGVKTVVLQKNENILEISSTMGCRTVSSADINAGPDIEQAFHDILDGKPINFNDPPIASKKDSRGNICPVTIILPTLAMQAKEKVQAERDKDKANGIDWEEGGFEKMVEFAFIKLLDRKIGEAKDMLLERFDWMCSQPAKSAPFMYENGTFGYYKPEEGVRSALKHGTLAIGQLGLAEALQIILGCDHTTQKGMNLAKTVEALYKEKCAKYKKELKLNFGVYYSPAESLCHTAMKKFKEKYGEIPNVSDREFFTNSMHVPVWHKMTPFEKIDIESQLTGYSSAGCITYVELDASTKNNIEALEKLVNYAMDKDIPYFAVNLPNDACECGYIGDIPDACPRCGSRNIKRLRRVTGYLSTTYEHFNLGKQAEVKARVRHTGVESVGCKGGDAE